LLDPLGVPRLALGSPLPFLSGASTEGAGLFFLDFLGCFFSMCSWGFSKVSVWAFQLGSAIRLEGLIGKGGRGRVPVGCGDAGLLGYEVWVR
jgi:hypothetical protein